jgi:DNA-binding NarL/FixJ family response regulator
MSFLKRMLHLFRPQSSSGSPHQQQGKSFRSLITELALQEQRSEEEVHADLLATIIAQQQQGRDLFDRWSALSPREQQVAVLVCRGYTNNEIAARLGIAPTTVKTHVKNVLTKYHFHSKDELRIALENWDFRAWD